jgi:hypothetical protein
VETQPPRACPKSVAGERLMTSSTFEGAIARGTGV